MSIKRQIFFRVYLIFVLFIVLGLVLTFRITSIQVKEGKYWRAFTDSIILRYDTVQPIRGNIFTRDEQLLVTSIPVYDVRIDFQSAAWTDSKIFNSNIDSLSLQLSKLFNDKGPSDYRKIISEARKKKNRYFPFKRNIDHNELNAMRTFPILKMGKYKAGMIVIEKSIRIRPYTPLAERTIGYKVEGIKGVGYEGSFNDYLAGKSGKHYMQKIPGGDWIPINYDNEIDPVEGKDIITTIDINIQDVTEKALQSGLENNNADNGCAVVMEVQTGKILAIANLTKAGENNYVEKYNYAIGASTEPGSTFKLASAILMLDNDFITKDEIIDTKNGQWKIYDNTIKDSKEGGYGKITFTEAFEYSSNVAFAKIVQQHFGQKHNLFYDGLARLGLVNPLNISISGEGMPYIKKPKEWVGTTLAYMAHGYELHLTPLHLLTLYNAVANDGRMVRPLFATEVRQAGIPIEKFETEVIKDKICSDKTLTVIKSMLTGVVENGTAKNIRTELYGIAGKTGTAKKLVNGKYANVYSSSFVGYFPADHPKYSCIVVINNPTGGEFYGAKVAAPVFREIADKLYAGDFRQLGKPDSGSQIEPYKIDFVSYMTWEDYSHLWKFLGREVTYNETPPEWVRLEDKGKSNVWFPLNFTQKSVPDVEGMTLTDAVYLLENLGFRVESYGYGKVQKQSILPGTKVSSKIVIKLLLG